MNKNFSSLDNSYCNVLSRLIEISETFNVCDDRTNVGTYKLFGNTLEVDISNGFPMLLSRRIPFKSVIAEFLFFLNGYTNNQWLEDRKCPYWKGFAHPETGELGPVYGAQLRNFNNQGIDQLAYLIDSIKNRPNSRRHMFTYFNPAVMPDENLSHRENIENGKAVLPPCHLLYQFNVEGEYIDGLLFQRSADWCIGTPTNIAQTALWIYTLAKVANKKPRRLVYMTGDTHMYANHIDGAKRVVSNSLNIGVDYPKLEIKRDLDDLDSLLSLDIDDFELIGYDPVGTIKFDLAI